MRFKIGCKTTNYKLVKKITNFFENIDFILIDEDILTINLRNFDSIWYEDKFELPKEVKEFLSEFRIPFVKIEKNFWGMFYTINDNYIYKKINFEFKEAIYYLMSNREHDIYSILMELSKYVEAKEKSEVGHSLRVAYWSKKFAQSLNLPEETCSLIYKGALFHDIGKISIPAEILTKPTKLTAEEYEINKKHADIGSLFFSDHAYSLVADIIRHHHERYDGNGYPDKLKCNEISLAAKIVALADSYDTMTSSRRYSNTIKNKEEALKEIIFCSVETEFGGKGCQFDPLLAENFCNFLTSN